MRTTTIELLAAACMLSTVVAKPDYYCPPTRSVLPAPIIPSDLVKKTSLRDTLKNLIKDPGSPFNTADTSFSVTVTSPEQSLFEFHHMADTVSEDGAQRVDGNTVYRIASVTKVFTTLSAVLQVGLDFDDYAWKHVPELEDLDDYKEITVRMLASHMSGIVRDGYSFDLTANTPDEVLLSLGFPNATAPADFQYCDSLDTEPCTREEFFKSVKQGAKTWLPGVTPSYSNYAFMLLGLVVEGYANKPLRDVIKETIAGPLNLKTSGLYIPAADKIITPPGYEKLATIDMSYWNP
jgi:CubicO group peptidase (beta-lactamase class C family)